MSFREIESVKDPEVQGPGSVLDTEGEEWVSVTEAAEIAAVTERTVRKWIAAEVVESRLLPSGNRDLRLVRRASLPLPGPWGSRADPEAGPGASLTFREPDPGQSGKPGAGEPVVSGNGAEADPGKAGNAEDAGPGASGNAGEREQGTPLTVSRNMGAPEQGASGNECQSDAVAAASAELKARLEGAHLAAKLHALRASEARRLIEEERERYEREREELTRELAFLREQLASRSDAEKELRVLLAHAHQTAQMLTERPVLTAGDTAPRRPWWRLWARQEE